MKILWLCSWYPNKLKPFDGDFIQRHAQAVSLLHEVQALFIKKDEEGKITKNVKEETNITGNLIEKVIYYKPLRTGIGIIDKIISDRQYKKLYRSAIQKYFEDNRKPSFVHVHVAMKAGIAALWLKKKYNVPYILSEHWTGYLYEAKPNFDDENFVYKKWAAKIFAEASMVTAVSKTLSQSLKERFSVDAKVIPNVVDTNIFFPVETQRNSVPKFIHVSTNTYQKNVEKILEAFKLVKENGYAFQLIFYVPGAEELVLLITKYNLSAESIIHEEVPQSLLAKDMRTCDALILYSHYETFGCVVIEANACGVPAILSDLSVFREYSVENKTVLFAMTNNTHALMGTVISFMEKRDKFSKKEIAETTRAKFNYKVVAKQFDQLYRSIIQL